MIEVLPGHEDHQATLKVNQQEVSWENLTKELDAAFSKRAEKVAFVRGDRSLDFQVIAEVLDVVHRAGAQRIGLITTATGIPLAPASNPAALPAAVTTR